MSVAENTERDWEFRTYDGAESDEAALYSMLGYGYCRSRAGHRAGVSRTWDGGENKPSPEDVAKLQAFLAVHRPIWAWLLENAQVTLAVDPADASTIWGWFIASEPNVVHALGVKRSVIKAGLGKELVLDMVGERWSTHQIVTLELPQIRAGTSGYVARHTVDLVRPPTWSLDPTWLLTRMVSR